MNAPTTIQTTETTFLRDAWEMLWARRADHHADQLGGRDPEAVPVSMKPWARLPALPDRAAVIWMTWLVAMAVRGEKPMMTMSGTESTGPPTPVRPEPKPTARWWPVQEQLLFEIASPFTPVFQTAAPGREEEGRGDAREDDHGPEQQVQQTGRSRRIGKGAGIAAEQAAQTDGNGDAPVDAAVPPEQPGAQQAGEDEAEQGRAHGRVR